MATPHSDENLARRLAADVDPTSEGAIRTVLETLKQDAVDPIPDTALALAAGLAAELPRPPSWLETFDRLAAFLPVALASGGK